MYQLDQPNQRPLEWIINDKKDKDDFWPPKKLLGHSIIYIEEENKYYCIGGNFNFYENFTRNMEFNTKLIQGVEKEIENFNKYDKEKLKYIGDILNYYNNIKCEVYSYELGNYAS